MTTTGFTTDIQSTTVPTDILGNLTSIIGSTIHLVTTRTANVVVPTGGEPTRAPPLLASEKDVIIFASVISAILGTLLVLAIVGWLLEQCEHFEDHTPENILRIFTKARVSSLPAHDGNVAPNNPDLPAWIRNRPTDFEMQQKRDDFYEFDDDNTTYASYDDTAHDLQERQSSRKLGRSRSDPSRRSRADNSRRSRANPSRRSRADPFLPSHGNPSTVVENRYVTSEMRAKPTSQRGDVNGTLQKKSLVQEMKGIFERKAGGVNSKLRNEPSDGAASPRDVGLYETEFDKNEDAYNQSIYSNDEIPPQVPRRDDF